MVRYAAQTANTTTPKTDTANDNRQDIQTDSITFATKQLVSSHSIPFHGIASHRITSHRLATQSDTERAAVPLISMFSP